MAPSTHPPPPIHVEYVPDLRELSPGQRQSLLVGPAVYIFDDDIFAMELPRALFLTASIEPRLIDPYGCIRLPPSTGLEPIVAIGCWLIALCSSPSPFNLRPTKDLTADLLICRAGRLLGMEKYIEHIHKHYWWKFHNKPFSAADVQTVLDIAVGPDDCFLRLVSERLAAYRRDGTVVDGKRMEKWIRENPRLKSCVEKAEKKWQTKMHFRKEKEEKAKQKEAREERERKLTEEEARVEEEMLRRTEAEYACRHAQWRKEEDERMRKEGEWRALDLDNDAKWAERRNKDAELHQSLQEKIHAGVTTVNREEARYYERSRGKPCPYEVTRQLAYF